MEPWIAALSRRRWGPSGCYYSGQEFGLLSDRLRSIESGEAAGEIGLEVLDVLEADVKTQGRTARLPLRGGSIACAVKWNNQAFKAAP